MTQKTRIKIPKENKVRAELQQEVNSVCPFCNDLSVGHFEIHHIDENPANNVVGNLFLLCPNCHSKITKGDISQIDVLKKKIELIGGRSARDASNNSSNVTFNDKVTNAVVGNNNNISIKQNKTVKQKYPEGCIGFDTGKANYIGHLIKRYNEYKEYEVGKENMNYAAFAAHLKKEYKIGPTRTIYNVPIDKFEQLAAYIQSRIDRTTLAKMKGKMHKNYSSFKEYVESQ